MDKVSSKSLTRKLMPGDKICYKGIIVIIGEILSQDYFNSDSEGNYPEAPDRSYVDIEFKDSHGKYHHWISSIDGGMFEYKEGNVSCAEALEKAYHNTGKTLQEVVSALAQQGFSQKEVFKSIVSVLKDVTWEDY